MIGLHSLTTADTPAVWERLGFAVSGRSATIGAVTVLLAGDGGRGITSWTLTGATREGRPHSVDGLPTSWTDGEHDDGEHDDGETDDGRRAAHRNGVERIDHLVVMTPDVERTVAAFEALGLQLRRRREGEAYGRSMRQAFFWIGAPKSDGVILEVVGPPEVDPAEADDPAVFFGLAFTVADLDETGRFFGELMKPPVDAVQAGRRITTISSRAGATVAIALMSPHPANDPPSGPDDSRPGDSHAR